MAKSPIDYKKIAGELKRLGFIDYDLRHSLTPGQKSNITRKFHANQNILKNPEDYAVKNITQHLKKEAKKAGIAASNKFLFIEKAGFEKVTVKTRKKGHGRKETTIYKVSKTKKEATKLIHGKRLLQALENVKGDLPPGEFITARVGKNAHFKRRFKNAKELQKYLVSFGAKHENLIDLLSVVKFTPEKAKGKKKNAEKEKRAKKGGRN